MARKVFISFLGTGKYSICKYTKDGFCYSTHFIQEATLAYHTTINKWTDSDIILTMLTDKAREKNWENSIIKDYAKGTEYEGDGLKSVLEQKFSSIKQNAIKIPEGNTENEIWDIFGKLTEYVEEDDELYIDVTHAFRFLPMLLLVFSNFVKLTKNTTVKSITYGNWEVSDYGKEPAPIVDLMPLVQLQNWTSAASQFIDSGSVKKLVNLSREKFIPILKETKGKDTESNNLKLFITNLGEQINNILLCRGTCLVAGSSTSNLRESYKELSRDSANPYTHIFSLINNSFNKFSNDKNSLNLLYTAIWCLDKEMYQLAVTYAVESMHVYIGELFGLNPLENNDQRILNGAFDYAAKIRKEPSLKGKLIIGDKLYTPKSVNIAKYLLQIQNDNGFIDFFSDFKTNVRNYINHAGIRGQHIKSSTLVKKLERFPEVFESFAANLKDNFAIKELSGEIPEVTEDKFFVNISHHPSKLWEDKQRHQARTFGEIRDITFPNIEPTVCKNDIENFCNATLESVTSIYQPENTTLHIMGEMTLTYRLVSHFKALGYKCVASTTERIVSYNENGEKVAKFDFVSFREY